MNPWFVVLSVWALASVLVAVSEFRDSRMILLAILAAITWPVILPATMWQDSLCDPKGITNKRRYRAFFPE